MTGKIRVCRSVTISGSVFAPIRQLFQNCRYRALLGIHRPPTASSQTIPRNPITPSSGKNRLAVLFGIDIRVDDEIRGICPQARGGLYLNMPVCSLQLGTPNPSGLRSKGIVFYDLEVAVGAVRHIQINICLLYTSDAADE